MGELLAVHRQRDGDDDIGESPAELITGSVALKARSPASWAVGWCHGAPARLAEWRCGTAHAVRGRREVHCGGLQSGARSRMVVCSDLVTVRVRGVRVLLADGCPLGGVLGVGVVAVSRSIPVRVGGVEIEVEAVPAAGTEPTSGRMSKAAGNVTGAFGLAQETIIEVARSTTEMIERSGEAARPSAGSPVEAISKAEEETAVADAPSVPAGSS
jgi:hypothetical protein